jgi:hypothetical protein
MSFFGTPRGLRRATATISAPFAPHFERRIRLAYSLDQSRLRGMRRPRLVAASAALTTVLLGCEHTPQPPHLPSRPTWEMFPRASSPPAECPGQYRTVIEDAHGDVFLGCWGQKTDPAVKTSF